MLRSIDLYVVLKLAVSSKEQTYEALASALSLSPSQVHRSVKSAQQSGLVGVSKHDVHRKALRDLAVHGVRYVYPAQRGAETRGVPTAHAAPPLKHVLTSAGLPLVWPSATGTMRGEALTPLYKHAPKAIQGDPHFYEVLALVDALRVGRARDQKLAGQLLTERLVQRRGTEARG
ncbi:MAG: hypothetical protein AAF730_19740 [Bacteroidota bacterium]